MASLACLGDSITLGVGDSLGIGWPGRLNNLIRKAQPAVDHRVYNLGIGGDRTAEIYMRYFSEALPRQTDFVILSFGTNDCQRAGDTEARELTSGRERLQWKWSIFLDTLVKAPHKSVLLGTTAVDEARFPSQPKMGTFKANTWYKNADLAWANSALKVMCAERNLPFIDFTPHWTEATATSHTVDGIHPNDTGYDLLASVIYTHLQKEGL